jgi:hypothetical protein
MIDNGTGAIFTGNRSMGQQKEGQVRSSSQPWVAVIDFYSSKRVEKT